jgi:hypothetical protein
MPQLTFDPLCKPVDLEETCAAKQALEVINELLNEAAKLNIEGNSKKEIAAMTKVNINITVFSAATS